MGYVLAVTAILLWGLVQIPIKLAKAPGRVGVMISMPAGIAAMALILLSRGKLSLPTATGLNWFLVAVAGTCQFPLATYMYFEAVQRAGISTAAPITRLTPILVVMSSAALGFGELSWSIIFAALLVFIGGIFLAKGVHRTHPIEARRDLRIGVGYALGACVMWAAGILAVSRIDADVVPSSLVVFYGLGIAAVVHWVIMIVVGRFDELRKVTRRDLLCYGTQGVVSFALGYWAFFESIAILGVEQSTVISGTWPVVAVIAGMVVFHEAMNLPKLLGTALLVGSAVLAGIGPWLERFLLTLWQGGIKA